MARTLRPRVHARGNRRLDGILDFLEFAARPMPIVTLLDEAPRRIAALVDAEVCSLYAVEGDKSEVVMRGNVGFRSDAIGQVRLRVGEGITGEAVEYLRPISTETAEQHGAYKHFAGLGEEHFPVFLAVPIRGDRGPLGALVVQRRTRPFRDADVELVAVLGGLIAAAIRHAELVARAGERGKSPSPACRRSPAARSVLSRPFDDRRRERGAAPNSRRQDPTCRSFARRSRLPRARFISSWIERPVSVSAVKPNF